MEKTKNMMEEKIKEIFATLDELQKELELEEGDKNDLK